MSATYGPSHKTAADLLEILRYYLPEAPLAAIAFGRFCGHAGSHESLRRRGREIIRRLREECPNQVGSCAGGYYLIRTREDRELDRDFRRDHALSELHTARRRQVDPAQTVTEGW